MSRIGLRITATLAVAAAMVSSSAVAAIITLPAVQDTTFNATNPHRDTNFNANNLRSHRGTAATPGLTPESGVTHVLVAFDLSNLASLVGSPDFEIVGAHLEYYQVSATTAGAHTHEVYSNDPADGVGMLNETTLTYNLYPPTYGVGQGESDAAITLGTITLAADSADGVYHAGAGADSSDLNYLNVRASKPNAVDQFAQFLLWSIGNTGDSSANQSRRLFGDHESGNPMKLVLDVNVPGSAHPGDFDNDGDVDGADFVAWQTNFPTATDATRAQGDADGDGDVDGADFVVWQTNFPFTPGSGATPVPEPAAWMLVLVAAIGSLRLRREAVCRGRGSCRGRGLRQGG